MDVPATRVHDYDTTEGEFWMIRKLLVPTFLFLLAPQAVAGDALVMLRGMSDYLARQATIEAKVDTITEVVTTSFEKLAFSSSSHMRFIRPNRLRVERIGGYAHIELIADGKTTTLRNIAAGTFAQGAQQGTIDDLAAFLDSVVHAATPGIDLLVSDPFAILSDGITSSAHIGEGVVAGHACEHLAFRTDEIDWQLWIRKGPDPIPCRMVITTKHVAQAPQFSVEVREWKSGHPIPDRDFVFRPASGERQVAPEALGAIGEVPPPTTGERK
jgi:hypothetical protein